MKPCPMPAAQRARLLDFARSNPLSQPAEWLGGEHFERWTGEDGGDFAVALSLNR